MREKGHIAQQCNLPKQDDSSPLSPTPLTPLDTPPIIETPTSSKRPHLETLSSIEEIPTNSQTDFEQPADRIPKKPRTSNIEEQLSSLKEHIETNASKYPLTYEELKHFYDNTRGSKDILSVARQYTEDIEGLVYMLSKIHQLFDNKIIKGFNLVINGETFSLEGLQELKSIGNTQNQEDEVLNESESSTNRKKEDKRKRETGASPEDKLNKLKKHSLIFRPPTFCDKHD
ncbi:hypothetical protein JTB14_007293 [Gonioctena quinquepunctata]|nr:hypothetical protein JTB14_007293 [Gonioctena quinquepunctata]